MEETRPEVVAQVENVMRSRLSAVGAQEYAAAGGVKSLADILNHSDRSTERNVLDWVKSSGGTRPVPVSSTLPGGTGLSRRSHSTSSA